ncbi:MAG TPA: hypothetical protein VGS06_18950 [Streptosporangiaceae bacterium]|nr:hypothetical protein [Streptosporangiaceae bacterium]
MPCEQNIAASSLDVRHWQICTAVALSIVAAVEVREAAQRRTAHAVSAAGRSGHFPHARWPPDMAG